MKRLKSHKAWRSTADARDDYIIRIYGWGKLRDHVRGYNVRFPRSWGHRQKYFAVKRYGSEAAALDRARSYRDKLVAAAGAPERRSGKSRRLAPFMRKRTTKNVSGIIGVARTHREWIAYYHPRVGKQVRRAWSIRKYTDEGARQLAILWRADMLRRLR